MYEVNRDISSQDYGIKRAFGNYLKKKEHLPTVVQLTWASELPEKKILDTKYERFMDSSE